MAWSRIATETLDTATTNQTFTGLSSNKFMGILGHIVSGVGGNTAEFRFGTGTITSTGYAFRRGINGAIDTFSASTSVFKLHNTSAQEDKFFVSYLANFTGEDKIGIGFCVQAGTAGANNAPSRCFMAGKFVNSSQIDQIRNVSGNLQSGTNLTILGSDAVAVLPNNVQDNSIFVEKDTANRYWFEGVPTAPTTTSNFPSGNNTTGSVNTRVDIPLTGISVSNGSVSFWVYRPSSGASADNQYVAFSVSNDTQASTEFFVGVYGNSNTVKLMSRNNGSWLVAATAGTVPVGAWSHIVYTNNTSTGNKIYVNGVVTSPSYSQGSASSDVFTDNISFNTSTIGASKDSSNGYEWGMIGNLQQLLIYGKTLSQADVTALYNGGKYGTPSTTDLLRKYELTSDANDTSGNGHNGTVAGSLTYTSLAIPQGIGTWTNPLENVGQIAQLSGSDSANSYTAASEFYSIPTDTWGSVFNIASGGRGRGGSAGTPTHCYLLGGQDGSKYYNEVDRIAWADKTQNATTMSGTRAWGNTVSNAVSVCVGQSFYYGSYSNSIDEFTYPTMTSTSQGNTSANFAFSGAFGNSSFGFVAKNATINKYTYSDKSNTNSSLATPPSPPNHAGHTGNSTVGMSINNSSASTNAKYDTYNIAANTWASNTVTSTTSYEDGRASGSTKYNLYSTQTNKSVARSCEKFNYGSGTLTSFTSVTTNLDGADGDAGASSNNTGVTS